MTIATIDTTRTHYSATSAAERTLTVGELRELLDQFDDDTPVVFRNDNGYTYGSLGWDAVSEIDTEGGDELQ